MTEAPLLLVIERAAMRLRALVTLPAPADACRLASKGLLRLRALRPAGAR
jgi:hypothetical protein